MKTGLVACPRPHQRSRMRLPYLVGAQPDGKKVKNA